MNDKTKGPNTSHWSIGKYANEVYIPRRLESAVRSITPRTAEWYKSAVGRFEKSLGGPVKLRTITPETIESFRQWCIDEGYLPMTAKKQCEVLRAIVRHWRPESMPVVNTQGRAAMSFLYADTPGTLEHLLCDRYLPAKPKIGPSTTRQYGKAFLRFSEFLERPATTDDLTDEKVGSFLRWLVEVKGVRAVSANGEAKQVIALWNWAAKKRLVEHFPTLDKLAVPELTPESWTAVQLRKLYAACQSAQGVMGGCQAADWWTAFHLLLWDTGERTGALLAMQWDWLDPEAGTLLVPGEYRKGGVKAMLYRLKPRTLESLERIRPPEREVIFANDWGMKSNFYYRYRKLVESAGLKYESHRSGPQKMRRTFASFIERNGGNATKALRHSTRRVTEQSYLDPRIAETESENVRLPDLGSIVDGDD